jgi:hypothetical protein
MKRYALVTFILLLYVCSSSAGVDDIRLNADPQQDIKARYRLFRTENIWTNLMLDTQTGRLWQIAITPNGGKGFPINKRYLVDNTSTKNGRFTLYPTGNMWNWILIDQDNGSAWQVQFAIENKNREFNIIEGEGIENEDEFNIINGPNNPFKKFIKGGKDKNKDIILLK